MKSLWRHAAILATGTFIMGLAHADNPKTPSNAPAPASANGAAEPGMKIYVDPATGKWTDRPVTEEQQREAAAQVDTFDASKVETINHPDGSIEYRMNGQLVDTIVATRGADGKLHMVCSQHGLEEHVHGAMSTTTSTQGARDDR